MSNQTMDEPLNPSPAHLPPVKIRATYDKNRDTLVATTAVGGTIVMAALEKDMAGGTISGAMDTFVSAMAGCVVHKIIEGMITRDQKKLTDVAVDLHGTRRPTPPTLFDTVHLTFTLTGDIDDAYAKTVISDILKNRCPLAATIGRASHLTWDCRILT